MIPETPDEGFFVEVLASSAVSHAFRLWGVDVQGEGPGAGISD